MSPALLSVAVLFIASFLTRRYWLVPLRLLRKSQPREQFRPRLVAEDERLPDNVREYLAARGADLATLGFAATPIVVESGFSMQLYLQRFENDARTTVATVAVAMSCRKGVPPRLFRSWAGFASRDASGREVATSSYIGAPGYPDRPGDSIVRVPEEDIDLLLRLHGAHLQRSGLTMAENAVGDPISYQSRLSDERDRWAVASGWFRDVGAARKRTVRGAFIATWRQLPPWSWIISRRETRVWQELHGVATGADLLHAFFRSVQAATSAESSARG